MSAARIEWCSRTQRCALAINPTQMLGLMGRDAGLVSTDRACRLVYGAGSGHGAAHPTRISDVWVGCIVSVPRFRQCAGLTKWWSEGVSLDGEPTSGKSRCGGAGVVKSLSPITRMAGEGALARGQA